MTPIHEDLHRRVEQLEKTVFIGNGTQSLVSKLATIEQKLDTVINLMHQQSRDFKEHDEKDFSEHEALRTDHNEIKSEVDILAAAYKKEQEFSFAKSVGNHKGVWIIIGVVISSLINVATHYFSG